jgi:peroxiredoxin
MSLLPRRPVPDLEIATLAGRSWHLVEQHPETFTMLVFYRGLHCPICGRYLKDLDNRLSQFEAKGVKVLALSSDTEERARQAWTDWRLEHLTLGYGLPLAKAREYGLYVSSGRGLTSAGVEEPAQFSEPGLFLLRPDRTLYFGAVQTMPFARPNFAEILQALDFVLAKDYPARGEVAPG